MHITLFGSSHANQIWSKFIHDILVEQYIKLILGPVISTLLIISIFVIYAVLYDLTSND